MLKYLKTAINYVQFFKKPFEINVHSYILHFPKAFFKNIFFYSHPV